ncbi:MAG TPA: indole-3-glycerol-phosphate synthase [Steroidobacteraceae bacterium]|nr:indole-3-glycerol-phosphate synthase [Steroidobacteraceae bacterium]
MTKSSGTNSDGDFLAQMAAASRERARTARAACPQAELLAQALAAPPPPRLRLQAGGFDLIAELKLRSPAGGRLKGPEEDVAARVTTYAGAGAAAVSVLTEPTRFDGSLEHLRVAARALRPLGVPAMRKDFLVDPYQVIEARAAGAGGVLAIVRMLSPPELEALVRQARALELFVLLEAFDEQDLERLEGVLRRLGSEGLLAGVNSRDLKTLQVVPSRLEQLAHRLPRGIPRVAESGVGSAEDARRVAEAGYDLALVGSALMSGSDPAALTGAMLSAARAARAGAVME